MPKRREDRQSDVGPGDESLQFLGPPGYDVELKKEIARQSGAVADAALTFKANLEAATSVASVPFLMAQQGAVSQRFHSLLTAERIRARHPSPEEETKDEQEKVERCRTNAEKKLQAELSTPQGSERLQDDIVRRLELSLEDERFKRAAQELLNETLVMVWGAFEVLVSDVIRAILNDDPAAALKVVLADPAKRHFRKDISIEVLASRGFDLNRSMGDVLFAEQPLDSLPRMRDVLSALFRDAARLHSAMAARPL